MDWLAQVMSDAAGIVKTIIITDIIDIAIISFIVYRLLLWVRRTSTAQVAKAILLILVALGLADTLNLNVIAFLLGRLVELGFLALVIVFQPEIRKFLEQIGNRSFREIFSGVGKVNALDIAISQTVLAYTAMSRDKIGALTVFQRKNYLDEVIVTGTMLDAAVSSELLKNIFWPNAPMHDGAVIIRNGRVAGAGCMLPLSNNVNLSRELGMRHRAGIGMSERSDAVVVIVSEETGSISVAVGGMLKRHLAPETLERLLRNELISKQEQTSEKYGIFAKWKKEGKGGNADGEEREAK